MRYRKTLTAFALLCGITKMSMAETLPPLLHPQMGYSTLLTAETQKTADTPTKFVGGISIAGGDFTVSAVTTPLQSAVMFKINIEVDPAHVGQQADLLFVMGTETLMPYEGGINTNYEALGIGTDFKFVDLYVPQEQWKPLEIASFMPGVALTDVVEVLLGKERVPWDGQFYQPGMYYIFVGYRLQNGSIIYNSMPIMLEVRAEGHSPEDSNTTTTETGSNTTTTGNSGITTEANSGATTTDHSGTTTETNSGMTTTDDSGTTTETNSGMTTTDDSGTTTETNFGMTTTGDSGTTTETNSGMTTTDDSGTTTETNSGMTTTGDSGTAAENVVIDPPEETIFNGERELLTLLKESVIEDSEEPYGDRIYYYDMALDNSGLAHVIYAFPQPDRIHTQIIYATEIGETWNKQILSTEGKYIPEGIQIALDGTGTFHVIYIKGTGDFDSTLAYRTISPSAEPSPEQQVSLGGWRSRLEINPLDNKPIIVRESPQGLSLYQLDAATESFQETVITLSQPAPSAFPDAPLRLGEFHIDAFGGFHLLYGDRYEKIFNYNKNVADFRHHLWYAFAQNPTADAIWSATVIDDSGSIWELEFWVDLTTTPAGSPIASTYHYNFAEMTNHKTYGKFFFRDDSGWHAAINTANQPPAPGRPDGGREGMGPGLVVDKYGYHGVWDNSPGQPYDFYTGDSRGGTFYRYSPDGTQWSVRQLIAPYSAEGRCETQLYKNQLNVLFLGDHTDTKLRLLRLTMPPRNVMQIYPNQVLHYQGDPVTLRGFYRGDFVGDWYLYAVQCLRLSINDKTCTGGQGDIWSFTEQQTWRQVPTLARVLPFQRNTAGSDFNGELQVIHPLSPPFNKMAEYDIYSVVTAPGASPIRAEVTLTPMFHQHIYANWPLP